MLVPLQEDSTQPRPPWSPAPVHSPATKMETGEEGDLAAEAGGVEVLAHGSKSGGRSLPRRGQDGLPGKGEVKSWRHSTRWDRNDKKWTVIAVLKVSTKILWLKCCLCTFPYRNEHSHIFYHRILLQFANMLILIVVHPYIRIFTKYLTFCPFFWWAGDKNEPSENPTKMYFWPFIPIYLETVFDRNLLKLSPR